MGMGGGGYVNTLCTVKDRKWGAEVVMSYEVSCDANRVVNAIL